MQMKDNQQDYNLLNNDQIQVLVSGYFGDGHFYKSVDKYSTNSINLEYILLKKRLLGALANEYSEAINLGYKDNIIYTLTTKRNDIIRKIKENSIEENLSLLSEMGVAFWFYDDGSRHKRCNFYNLNTHFFSEEIQQDLFLPFFKENLGVTPKILKDVKKDGRVFSYLFFGKQNGAFEIASLLQKYPVKGYEYKLWSSETISKESKFRVELKHRGVVPTNGHQAARLFTKFTKEGII